MYYQVNSKSAIKENKARWQKVGSQKVRATALDGEVREGLICKRCLIAPPTKGRCEDKMSSHVENRTGLAHINSSECDSLELPQLLKL